MKAVSTLLVTLALALAGSAASAATILGQNLLGNPGFEEGIRYEPPFDDNWLAFFGPQGEPPLNLFAGVSPIFPLSGNQSLELTIIDFSGTFVGVVQQVKGLHPGLTATFSGWLTGFSSGGSLDSGVQIRIEWIDSASGQEIGRTPDLMPTPGESYEMFSVTGIVPEGADQANVVIALVSQFGPALANVVSVDDTSFTVIPLPGALILMLGALLPLSLFRKRVA